MPLGQLISVPPGNVDARLQLLLAAPDSVQWDENLSLFKKEIASENAVDTGRSHIPLMNLALADPAIETLLTGNESLGETADGGIVVAYNDAEKVKQLALALEAFPRESIKNMFDQQEYNRAANHVEHNSGKKSSGLFGRLFGSSKPKSGPVKPRSIDSGMSDLFIDVKQLYQKSARDGHAMLIVMST